MSIRKVFRQSAGKPNDHESSLLELLVDRTGGDAAVIGDRLEAGGVRVVGTDPTVEDYLHAVDAREARHEVLVEVRAILGDDDEYPHAGSLPRTVQHGVRFLSGRRASSPHRSRPFLRSDARRAPAAARALMRNVATLTLARRLLLRPGPGDMRCE